MNPFEKFGLEHLSYSQASLYKTQPAAWVFRYLFKIKDDGGPALWRGRAVEKGLDTYLFTQSEPQAMQAASIEYGNLSGGLADEKSEQERANVGKCLMQAIKALPGPLPISRQKKIEIRLDGIEVPIIGFVDYEWPDYGVDLKTTLRLPSRPNPIHVEQVSLYAAALGKPFSLMYVTPMKSAVYPISDDAAAVALKRVHQTFKAIRSMLEKVDGPHQAASMFAPDYEHYSWSPELMKKAEEVYGQ